MATLGSSSIQGRWRKAVTICQDNANQRAGSCSACQWVAKALQLGLLLQQLALLCQQPQALLARRFHRSVSISAAWSRLSSASVAASSGGLFADSCRQRQQAAAAASR
jgi:hypothetical protein